MSVNIQKIMENSKNEFTLICAGLIYSDDIVDLNEIKYSHKLISKMFGDIISLSEFIDVVNNYEDDSINKVMKNFYDKNKQLLSGYEKEYLIITLIILGLSDFEITKKEIIYLKSFAKSLNLSDKIVENLIQKTNNFTEKIRPENIL
tara:strand:- start:16 stop:456 length:441 start_codon:yes stop_codon:yes gene_type:complete